MINLEQLKERFPTQNVPPYGECVIVPGTVLDEGGYGCIFTDINSKAVTLVLTRKRQKEPPTPEPARKHPPSMKGPLWKREDEDRLVKRMSEVSGTIDEKCGTLTKEFQGRSPNALKQKFRKLVAAGRAQPGKRGRPKKVVTREGLEKSLKNVCRDCGLPKDLCCCDEEKKESLRQEPWAPVQKQEPRTPLEKLVPSGLMQFETYCRKCGTRRTVEDHDVWRVCPICEDLLIVWDVQESL